jgi:uncharacterized membrane protein YdbT with pleckstrin-like domain
VGYIDQNLISGETVLYRTRLHWIVMIPALIGAVIVGLPALGIIIGAIATMNDKQGGAGLMALAGFAVLLIAAMIVGIAILRRSSVEMAVTNKRVLAKRGLISRTTVEMMLGKIESIAVDQTVFGRMFNFGTIIVRGTGGTPEPFPKIAHPLEFRRQVQQQLDKLQNRAATAGAQ